ncbi:MAG: ribosome assembly cofactor RimP [Muribaculaceae bacterium]|nr:ribosome assembly cofactor RimP [Muribaculaceae bacterium]
MIDIQLLRDTVEESIANTDIFVVDIRVGAGNSIVVELDSDTRLDIDTCARVTRAVEAVFDRDVEDYDLEVGSAGLTSPFKVRRQYEKNLGNRVEVLTADGRKLAGVLARVGDDGITLEIPVKTKIEGKKRPQIVETPFDIPFDNIKQAKYIIEFK